MLVFLGIVLSLFIGMMIGFVVGVIGDIGVNKQKQKEAIKDGIIMLDGKYFKLKSLFDNEVN